MKTTIIVLFTLLLSFSAYGAVHCDLYEGPEVREEAKINSWTSTTGVNSAYFLSKDSNYMVAVGYKDVFERDYYRVALWKVGKEDEQNTQKEYFETKVIDGKFDLSGNLPTSNLTVRCFQE